VKLTPGQISVTSNSPNQLARLWAKQLMVWYKSLDPTQSTHQKITLPVPGSLQSQYPDLKLQAHFKVDPDQREIDYSGGHDRGNIDLRITTPPLTNWKSHLPYLQEKLKTTLRHEIEHEAQENPTRQQYLLRQKQSYPQRFKTDTLLLRLNKYYQNVLYYLLLPEEIEAYAIDLYKSSLRHHTTIQQELNTWLEMQWFTHLRRKGYSNPHQEELVRQAAWQAYSPYIQRRYPRAKL
jgi:hypothetical protein